MQLRQLQVCVESIWQGAQTITKFHDDVDAVPLFVGFVQFNNIWVVEGLWAPHTQHKSTEEDRTNTTCTRVACMDVACIDVHMQVRVLERVACVSRCACVCTRV